MFEKIAECPVCSSPNFKNQLICLDHLVSGESFVLADCKSCGLRLTNPRPDKASISRYYQSENYLPHKASARNSFSILYKIIRSYNLIWKKQLISTYATQGTLLDFGAGTGEFALKMLNANWQVFGVESSPEARETAKKKYDLDIVENVSYLPDNQTFNAITLWHVLEHLHDTNGQIRQLSALLKKEGRLFIALPNYESYDSLKYTQDWAGYDVPRHLTHFNRTTMKKFLKKNGLTLLKTIPMKFDAFYVSILSERNKNAAFPFLRGIYTGFKSNREAAKNDDNYSSLLYIAKK